MSDLPETAWQSGWRTVRRLTPFLWPADDADSRRRVALALAALLLAKLATVATPVFFKAAVDGLAPAPEVSTAWYLAAGPVALTVFYGLMRLAGAGFTQLRDGVFASVGQRALRMMAIDTFRHVHALGLRYHLGRRTGGLNRIIDRGVKGVDVLLRYLLFSVVPMLLELVLVAVILWFVFDVWYLVVVAVTVVAYGWFTFRMTEFRRAGARADERARHRRQPEGGRQPAELRDGQVLQRRGTRDRPLRRLVARLRAGRGRDRGHAVLAERGAGADHHRRPGGGDGDGGAGGAGRRADRRRLRHGQRLHGPDHAAARLPRLGLPRHPPGPGRHGGDVRPAGAAGGDRRPARGAGAGGRPWSHRVPGRPLRLRARAADPARPRPGGRARADGGGGRALGGGKVDAGAAAVPLLRRHRRARC